MKLYEVRLSHSDGTGGSVWFARRSDAESKKAILLDARPDDGAWPELFAHEVIRETKATSLMCILLNGNVDHLITSTTVLFRHEPRTKPAAADGDKP